MAPFWGGHEMNGKHRLFAVAMLLFGCMAWTSWADDLTITADKTTVAVGGAVALQCTVPEDLDLRDPCLSKVDDDVTVTWSACIPPAQPPAGSFSPAQNTDSGSNWTAATTWTAPAVPGIYTIKASASPVNPVVPDWAGPKIGTKIIHVIVCDSISLTSVPAICSVNDTNISFSATVTCLGQPAPNLTVTFASSVLTFPNGATATTNSSGVATVSANAGSSPSWTRYAEAITASVGDGCGNTLWTDDNFTVVRVNSPTPANPAILDGGYPDDSLYTITLTYTVSPAVSGVPVSFAFETGEGAGVDVPASLENASTSTDANGQATVKVRSSDLEETATVKCTYHESCGSTDVTFQGITGVSDDD